MKCVTPVLKLLLCLLLLFCSALIGLHLSRRLSRRREILLGFEQLLRRASLQIAYTSGDLYEIFSDNESGFQFDRALPFDTQWTAFVDRFDYYLSADDKLMLRGFSERLGTADGEAQQKHLALYIGLLSEHIENAREDIRTRSKMLRIVPLAAGAVLSIMLM